ncbi:MAG TPA: 4-hydroxy-3-methylbut-2-enyl diphosphate reductase [Blastocatellia bacterium]|nr:4-hydroxy-3-methylbut-2-enyl diphosphate reductase [Blastocatellia bacterium]
MEVILADVHGFCSGVRRAIDLVEHARVKYDSEIYTLGALIHNPQEVARLDQAGIKTLTDDAEVTSGVPAIRTHGAPPQTFARLKTLGQPIVDTTCPYVKYSQHVAREFCNEGYDVIIMGDKNHPEVKGIVGYCTRPVYVIKYIADINTLPPMQRAGIMAQTTVNESTFLKIAELLRARVPEVKFVNTICNATHERQESVSDLSRHVDVLYVVGGRTSSNSNKLVEVGKTFCAKTFLIETADEINESDLTGVEKVGVTAGASTPDWLIQQVVDRIKSLDSVAV